METRKGFPALSIRQPWAWAVASGIKDVENRVWTTRYRGVVLIHAGLRVDPAGLEIMRRRRVKMPPTLTVGAIIGRATLIDIVSDSRSRWAVEGQFHFVFEKARLTRPVLCKGQLGLFWPKEVR